MAKRLFTVTNANCLPVFHTRELLNKGIICQAKRTFLDKSMMRLTNFLDATERAQSRFGAVADSFKHRFKMYLDEPNCSILHEDFLAFTYLSDKEELPALLRASNYLKQQQDDEKNLIGDSGKSMTLDPIILRKLHVLNMPDEALQYFEDHGLITGPWHTLSVVLDVLYENGRYEKCLDMTIEYTEKNKEMLYDLYKLAAAAAYKSGRPDALKKLAKVFDHMKASMDVSIADGKKTSQFVNNLQLNAYRIRRVIALMCIEQGHNTAAISLLSDRRDQPRDVLELNLMLKALLKLGRISQAQSKLQLLMDIHRKDFDKFKDGADNRLRKFQLKKDVYEDLLEVEAAGSLAEPETKRMEYLKIIAPHFVGNRTLAQELLYLLLPWSIRKENMQEASVGAGGNRSGDTGISSIILEDEEGSVEPSEQEQQESVEASDQEKQESVEASDQEQQVSVEASDQEQQVSIEASDQEQRESVETADGEQQVPEPNEKAQTTNI